MPDLRSQLQQLFGLDDFRPSQRDVIEDVLRGKDVLCVMPTGAGKSLCFQLPAAIQKGLTVVVSPLISLMADQVRQMDDEQIPALLLNSSQTAAGQRDVLSAVEQGFEGLLYVAPERFAAPGFQALLARLKVKLLAIDEAHCISMWGHDFRPDYARLGAMRKLMHSPPTIALTATATEDVRGDIIRNLGLRDPSIVVTGFDRPNLSYQCRVQNKEADKTRDVIELLRQEKGSAIVYCSTRKAVDALSDEASDALKGRCVVAYHAGMKGDDRTTKQSEFMSSPGAIAIATNAFGMGINKPDVRQVIHYNITGTLEQYYQEAGRAGRDGLHARCVLFYSVKDVMIQKYFISKIGNGHEDMSIEMLNELTARAEDKLDLMTRFAKARRCRRKQILDYFGDESEVEDCACDVCGVHEAPDVPPLDDAVVTLVRQILSAVARLNGKAGVGTIAEVLAGERSEKVLNRQLDSLSVFGLLKKFDVKPLIAMTHKLIDAGLAQQRDFDGEQHYVVELTAAGAAVMKGNLAPPAVLSDLMPRKRKGPRARGANPRALGTNPRALGTNPKALYTNPRALGTNPKALGTNPRTVDTNPRALREQDDYPLDELGTQRFDRLRTLRTQLAHERQLPAYVICNDQVLKRIATEVPDSVEALERIKGMGPMKVKLYGAAILDAIS